VTVCACFDGVEVSFAGYFESFIRVWERAVAVCRSAAAASARVVVVVLALAVHQEKKCASGGTGYILTHQALGMLCTHPGSTHTAPNAKRTGNVNSDAARHGTICPDPARHGICLPDRAWQGIFVLDPRCHGIFLLDPRCQGIFLLDPRCQGIFLLDAAVSGHFPSGRSRVRAVVKLAVKARNIASNTRVAFTNTQRVPGIVTQSSSILYI